MSATLDRGSPASANRLAAYAYAGRSAVRRKWPGWLIATVDVGAVLFALGLVHAINGMIFKAPPATDVAAADEAAIAPGTRVPVTNFAKGRQAGLVAQLVKEARAAFAAAPGEQILFAEPASLEMRFSTSIAPPQLMAFVNPAETPAADRGTAGSSGRAAGSAGLPDEGGTGSAPPPMARPNPDPGTGHPPPAPTEPEPVLLVYVPLPEATAEVLEEIAAPPMEAIARVVDKGTGPPLDLTERIGVAIDVSVGDSEAGDNTGGSNTGQAASVAVSTSASSSGASGSGESSGGSANASGTSIASAATQVTSAATGTLSSTVSSTVSSVGSLLR